MAELIYKKAIFTDGVFLVDKNNPMASVGELINRISNAPTTTEAEIRAKAIDEMVERIKIHTRVVGTTYLEDIDEIAEQLKGE